MLLRSVTLQHKNILYATRKFRTYTLTNRFSKNILRPQTKCIFTTNTIKIHLPHTEVLPQRTKEIRVKVHLHKGHTFEGLWNHPLGSKGSYTAEIWVPSKVTSTGFISIIYYRVIIERQFLTMRIDAK